MGGGGVGVVQMPNNRLTPTLIPSAFLRTTTLNLLLPLPLVQVQVQSTTLPEQKYNSGYTNFLFFVHFSINTRSVIRHSVKGCSIFFLIPRPKPRQKASFFGRIYLYILAGVIKQLKKWRGLGWRWRSEATVLRSSPSIILPLIPSPFQVMWR